MSKNIFLISYIFFYYTIEKKKRIDTSNIIETRFKYIKRKKGKAQ